MKQKKRPPGWRKTGRNGGGCESPCSKGDYTTRLTKMQAILLECLHFGAEHAMTTRDLTNATGFSGRLIRRMFHEMRLSGVPLVSDTASGCWLSSIPSELRHCSRSLRHRARETVLAADALDATADALEKKAVAT